jgi:hypothetical protein
MLFQITFWTVAILSLAGTVLIFSAIAIGALKPENQNRIEPRAHWTKGTSGPSHGRGAEREARKSISSSEVFHPCPKHAASTRNGKDRHV